MLHVNREYASLLRALVSLDWNGLIRLKGKGVGSMEAELVLPRERGGCTSGKEARRPNRSLLQATPRVVKMWSCRSFANEDSIRPVADDAGGCNTYAARRALASLAGREHERP